MYLLTKQFPFLGVHLKDKHQKLGYRELLFKPREKTENNLSVHEWEIFI